MIQNKPQAISAVHYRGLGDAVDELPHSDTQLDMSISFERQQFFWSRVRKDGEHLIWEGADTPRGYGKMTIGTEVVYSHRVAWCIAHGLDLEDIEDKTIIRTCDRNDCVEATHLAARQKKVRKTT